MKKSAWALAAAATLLASACAEMTAGDASRDPLAGSAWRLVAIHSMDDAQGTTKVSDPDRFTLELGADGRAALRLDCNRGAGKWEAKPAGDGRSGTFQFGAIATTRAFCPQPNIDARVSRDLTYVRGYRLKDGHLYLTLMADGGIYEWQRR